MLFNRHAPARIAAIAAALCAAAPAKAEYQVAVMRLSGEWQTSLGVMQMTIDAFEGAAQARILDASGSTPRFLLWRDPSDAGEAGGANFYWVPANGTCRVYTLRCVEGRINLKLDATGRSFEAVTIAGRPIEGSARWSGRRLKNSTAAERTFADWLGPWTSSNGPVTFRVEGEVLVGEFQKPGTGAQGRGVVTLFPGGVGAWALPDASSLQRGRADLRLAADKKSFAGTYEFSREDDAGAPRRQVAWTGARAADPASGASPTGPVVATPGPVVVEPAPGAPPASPPTAVGFKPAGKFDVRLDRVVAEDRYWHVYLTLRNASTMKLLQSEDLIVRFEDSDGVGVESGQSVRAKPGYPELFGSPPPSTRPGGTLAVKFIFDKRSGADPARVIVIDGDQQAEFTLG